MTPFLLGPATTEDTGEPLELQTFEADCPATVAVDDVVRISGPLVAGRPQVDVADPLDKAKVPAIGVVIDKPTLTTCVVQTFGQYDPPTSVTPGKPVFLGTGGQVSSSFPTPPPSGVAVVQPLGIAMGTDLVFLNVQPSYVTRRG